MALHQPLATETQVCGGVWPSRMGAHWPRAKRTPRTALDMVKVLNQGPIVLLEKREQSSYESLSTLVARSRKLGIVQGR
ncbi:MAG: hypothetical protein QOC89_712 [Paraburkholderia sp.]|nr:hypothetical protein [Paraburkholderia sp.]